MPREQPHGRWVPARPWPEIALELSVSPDPGGAASRAGPWPWRHGPRTRVYPIRIRDHLGARLPRSQCRSSRLPAVPDRCRGAACLRRRGRHHRHPGQR